MFQISTINLCKKNQRDKLLFAISQILKYTYSVKEVMEGETYG